VKIYAIADLHLSFHESIDKPMKVFGEGWDHHEERLEKNWKKLISDEDIILLPGDLSWGLRLDEAMPDLEWIHNMPGRKVLIKGNHDLWWSRIQHLKSLYDDMFFLQNDCCLIEPESPGGVLTAICGTRGWILPGSDEFTEHDRKIYEREIGRLRNSLDAAMRSGAERIIAALHYPPADNVRNQSEFTELMEKYPVTDCVYGHLHGMAAFSKRIQGEYGGIRYRLVSLDFLGAEPVEIAR